MDLAKSSLDMFMFAPREEVSYWRGRLRT